LRAEETSKSSFPKEPALDPQRAELQRERDVARENLHTSADEVELVAAAVVHIASPEVCATASMERGIRLAVATALGPRGPDVAVEMSA
jgi:hypothetical protein